MTWEAFYLLAFLVGLGLTVGSFVTGARHGAAGHHVGFGGHHVGRLGGAVHGAAAHGAPGPGQAAAAHAHAVSQNVSESISPFNFISFSAFLIWFGGVGYILSSLNAWSAAVIGFVAAAAGLAGGLSVFLFLARVLLPGQTSMDPDDYQLVGTVGHLSMNLRAGGTGEVVYVQGGSRKSMGARSDRGQAIPQGTEVVIVGYEKGIALIEPLDEYIRS